MLWDVVTGKRLNRVEGWDVVSLQKKSKSIPGTEKLEAGVDRYGKVLRWTAAGNGHRGCKCSGASARHSRVACRVETDDYGANQQHARLKKEQDATYELCPRPLSRDGFLPESQPMA